MSTSSKLSGKNPGGGYDVSAISAIAAAGIVYGLFCVPIAWIYATQAGKNPVHAILLLDIPKSVQESLHNFQLPKLDTPEEVAFWSSLGVAYATVSLIAAFLLSGPRKMIDTAAAAFSFFYGYVMVVAIIAGPSAVLRSGLMGFSSHLLKIIYIYAGYVIFEALKNAVASRIHRAEPFKFLVDGLFGIFVALFISYGHERELPEIFAGPLFLICSFACLLFCEHVVLRTKLAMVLSLGRVNKLSSRWKKPESGKIPISKLLAAAKKQIRKEITKPIGNLIARAERIVADSAKPMSPRTEIDFREFGAIFFLSMLWPLFALGVNWLILRYVWPA